MGSPISLRLSGAADGRKACGLYHSSQAHFKLPAVGYLIGLPPGGMVASPYPQPNVIPETIDGRDSALPGGTLRLEKNQHVSLFMPRLGVPVSIRDIR